MNKSINQSVNKLATKSTDQAASNIQLVCFDLGGVLIRICHSWQEAAQCARVPISTKDMERIHGPKWISLLKKFETGQIDSNTFCQLVAEIIDAEPAHILACVQAWLKGPYHRVAELFNHLKSKPIKLACLSNTNELHWKMMHTEGENYLPLDLLDFQFASQLIGEIKPNPSIFKYVEKQTGIASSAIQYFDDNADNIAMATQCGWQAHIIDPSTNTVPQISGHLKWLGL